MIPGPRQVLGRIVLLCLGVRIGLQVVGMSSLAAHGHAVWPNALALWSNWDASHYLRIAEIGYRAGTPPPDDPLFIVFFPFFPLVARITSIVFRDLILSGLIVSFAASIGASWFLYQLALDRSDHQQAWRAVVLLQTFPTAYFLAAPYSEALFLFAVLASIYAARKQLWPRAALAGALATGTRVTGLALLPALGVEAVRRSGRWSERALRLGWASLAGFGAALYLGVNRLVHGDAFWFLEVQRSHWDQQATLPWRSMVDAVSAVLGGLDGAADYFIYVGRLSAFAFAVALLVAGARQLKASDEIYAWTSLVMMISVTWLISLPRYLLVIYPLFLVTAHMTRSRIVFWPWVTAGAAVQIAFFWRYAVGRWTF